MANALYTAAQVAKVAVNLAQLDGYLSALVNRDALSGVFEGGGKGRTVNLRIPAALVARTRGLDDKTSQIVLDELTESTVGVTTGTHVYSAVALSEGDLSLNIEDFSAQVLAPQMAAIVEELEAIVADVLLGVDESNTSAFAYDAANPTKILTAMRKYLRDNGLPMSNLNVVAGTQVYADLLNAGVLKDASQSGSTEALREGNVGRVSGFTVAESNRIPETQIIAFHRDAVALAQRAPLVPQGASFGAVVAEKGYSLRYIRDYDVMSTADRSLVSTFAGAAILPVYKVARNRTTKVATVSTITNGGILRVDTATATV